MVDTASQHNHRVLFPPQPDLDVDVCLPAEKITGKICIYSRTFLFSYELTDLSHCISLKAVGRDFLWNSTSFPMWNRLSLCSLHVKYIKTSQKPRLQAFLIFSAEPKNLWTHKCVPTSSMRFLSLCYLFNQDPKV